MRETFGQRLKKMRKERNLSQHQLGRLAGVTDTSIWHWEHDKNPPQFSSLKKLSRALGVDPKEFAPELVKKERIRRYFGTWLKKEREKLGLTQEQVAEFGGVGWNTISGYERNLYRPQSLSTIRQIVRALKEVQS